MITLTTLNEITKHLEKFNTYTTIGFQRKQTNKLHEGHANLIQYASSKVDCFIAAFWDYRHTMNYILQDVIPDVWKGQTDGNWDQTYCAQFSENNGTDVFFVPDYTVIADVMSGVNKTDLMQMADNFLTNEGLILSHGQKHLWQGWAVLMYALYESKGLLPKHTHYFLTWKEGFYSYCKKKWLENVLNVPVEMLETIKTSDGLNYSSLLTEISSSNLDKLKQFQTTFDNTISSQSAEININKGNYFDILLDDIRLKFPDNKISGKIRHVDDEIIIEIRLSNLDLTDMEHERNIIFVDHINKTTGVKNVNKSVLQP